MHCGPDDPCIAAIKDVLVRRGFSESYWLQRRLPLPIELPRYQAGYLLFIVPAVAVGPRLTAWNCINAILPTARTTMATIASTRVGPEVRGAIRPIIR